MKVSKYSAFLLFVILTFTFISCKDDTNGKLSEMTGNGNEMPDSRDNFIQKRLEMTEFLRSYSSIYKITDERVLNAMKKVPRHKFVPDRLKYQAYEDTPLPIGYGQTISQPFIVAYMTQMLELKKTDKVLEIGTGSGYQAAVIAEIVSEGGVYTVEIIKPLAEKAGNLLKELGYKNITVKYADGYKGFKEYAPFDAIIITCAPDDIPDALISQLETGGRLAMPLGQSVSGLWGVQELLLLSKTKEGIKKEKHFDVRFVPMVKSQNK